jgi:hypothetical protein
MEDMKPHSCCSEEAPPPLNRQAYSEDGVDLTLIRWMLSLTPYERLQALQQNVQSLARLCNEGPLS